MTQNKLNIKAEAKNLNFFYADGTKALKNDINNCICTHCRIFILAYRL